MSTVEALLDTVSSVAPFDPAVAVALVAGLGVLAFVAFFVYLAFAPQYRDIDFESADGREAGSIGD